MSTQLFYRVEDEDRSGCYRTYLGVYEVKGGREFQNVTNHPLPGEDSLLVERTEGRNIFSDRGWGGVTLVNYDFIFGFESIEQYRRWFYDDNILVELAKNGYKLSVYESEEMYAGRTQAIAHREKLTLIERRDLL